jgi:hypothetical protein
VSASARWRRRLASAVTRDRLEGALSDLPLELLESDKHSIMAVGDLADLPAGLAVPVGADLEAAADSATARRIEAR